MHILLAMCITGFLLSPFCIYKNIIQKSKRKREGKCWTSNSALIVLMTFTCLRLPWPLSHTVRSRLRGRVIRKYAHRYRLFLFSSSCHLSFSPVPIIPTFLYAIEHQTQERPSDAPSEAQLASVFSLYDNNTYTTSTANLTISSGANGSSGVNGSSAERHGCKEDSEFLEEENVRVGLLFASKAMVQLMVNPFVGPLTNRYIYAE